MNKRFFIVDIIIIILAISSCSNPQSEIVIVPDSETLRSESDIRFSQVEWSSEIEGDKLSVSEPVEQNLTEFLPKTLCLLNTGAKPSVYPELTGFGSLDTSELTTDIKNKVDSFIKDFFDGKSTSTSLRSDRNWLPFILRSSLSNFTSCDNWVYGKPFISADVKYPVYELPVRLYFNKTYVDIVISLLPESIDKDVENDVFIDKEVFLQQSFLIDQIRVGDIIRG